MPIFALRERAVTAYETTGRSYARDFSIGQRTLERWVTRARETGSPAARERGGGQYSPVAIDVMLGVVTEKPDGTTEELTRLYNGRVGRAQRVHRSSLLRALRRLEYVFKETSAARRSRPPRRPSKTGGLPRLARDGRPEPLGVSR